MYYLTVSCIFKNHAGPSTWDGTDSLNYHSIGIEIVNPGFVEKLADGSFRRGTYGGFKTYPAANSAKFLKAEHKHKFWTNKDNHYWGVYPDAQLQALYKLSKALVQNYHLDITIGHDDSSPARKPDPGPAFSWDAFKKNVYGSVNNIGKIYLVNTEGTNFRSGPSTADAAINKLSKGYEVGLISTSSDWSKVYLLNNQSEVLEKVNGKVKSIKTIGWVSSPLLTLKAGQ